MRRTSFKPDQIVTFCLTSFDGSALAHFVLRGEKLAVEGWSSIGKGGAAYYSVGLQRRQGGGGEETLGVEVCQGIFLNGK